jgi:hypothetical protein
VRSAVIQSVCRRLALPRYRLSMVAKERTRLARAVMAVDGAEDDAGCADLERLVFRIIELITVFHCTGWP